MCQYFHWNFSYKYADIANKNRIQRMFCVEIKIILDSVTQFLLLAKNRLKRILLNGDIALKKGKSCAHKFELNNIRIFVSFF